MKKTELKVSGMHCHSCELLISEALKESGASVVNVSHQKGIVSILFDDKKLNDKKIKSVIEKEGYKVVG